ncbi:MAG: hypothetical protein JST26_10570 [Bacteroidetes bacterium]|nr:hypothetical protein [Bacteroidota bacterium]
MLQPFRHILLLFITQLCFGQRTTFDYLRKSDSVFTVLYSNENWMHYYHGDRSAMRFVSADGIIVGTHHDTLNDLQPQQIVISYAFVMPEDLTVNGNCSSIDSILHLKYDSTMVLTNPEVLSTIPAFIKTAGTYKVLHPRRVRIIAESYRLPKGIGPWHYCLSYVDSTKTLIWTVRTKLKEETKKEPETEACLEINAITGEFIRRYDAVTQNLSEHPEKYKRK